MTKNKLYLIVLIACFSGYLYLIFTNNYSENGQISVCMIKNATGYACPSCGTTRAVQALLKGDLIGSYKCVEKIEKTVGSTKKKTIIMEDKHHNVFYSPSRHSVYEEIIKFFNEPKSA